MSEKELASIDPSWWSVAVAVLFALLGSIVRNLIEWRKTGKLRLKLREWAVDMLVSGFVGLIVGSVLIGFGTNEMAACGIAGYFGHLGARGLALAAKHLKERGLV